MNTFKKALIACLAFSAITTSAYAKCPGSTYNLKYDQKITVQQLIDQLNQIYCQYSGTCTNAKPTAAPVAKPTAAPTAKPTAVPVAKPTAAPAAKPTAAPSTASNASTIEKEVFDLVNEVRAQYGLTQLTWANDLANVARAHSRDMIDRNFFSHTNPDGLSPFDRLRSKGISYRTAAENIAYGQKTPKDVMNAWMNSSGHRANILNANVRELGVGAVTSPSGTIYWTQVFVAR